MAVMQGRLHLTTLSSVQIEWELSMTSSVAGQSDYGRFEASNCLLTNVDSCWDDHHTESVAPTVALPSLTQ